MEGEGSSTIPAVAGTPSPRHHLDVELELSTVVGSPNDHVGFEEEETAAVVAPPASVQFSENIVLEDDLRDKIIRQVEYYFSDENLPTDKYLLKFVKKNKEGFVPIPVIASFRKMQKLVQNNTALVVAAVRESSQLVVTADGKRVKRIHPLPNLEVKDVKEAHSHTVLVENLPENYSVQSLQKIFGAAGKVNNVCIRNPHGTESSKEGTKGDVAVSGKVHALVEYETVAEAEKAVSTLNDTKNWRSGMRVEILFKRLSKYGLAKRSWKAVVPEKKTDTEASEKTEEEQRRNVHECHNQIPAQEEEEIFPSEKSGVGGRKGRNRNRSRGQKQKNMNGQVHEHAQAPGRAHVHGHEHGFAHGHGHSHGHRYWHGHGHGNIHILPSGSEGTSMIKKPPPGPKMPDGTKGFTAGRGRPLVGNRE